MTIAVHISFTGSQKNILANFNYRCFTILAGKFPGDHFIFIFDRPYEASLITHSNITPVLLTPQIRNRLLQHYWYNYKIPRLLNKYNAMVFVSGDCVCSLRTKVTQCMLVHDLSFLQKNNSYSNQDIRYLKKYLKTFVHKANLVAVSNSSLETTVTSLFPEAHNKTNVIKFGLDDSVDPLIVDKANKLKEELTAGKEYFLYYSTNVTTANTITVLKAFSIFKKWQKSNMQLVILNLSPLKENIRKDLATYKYRDDVHIIADENTDRTEILIASAYAVIYLPETEVMEPVSLLVLKNNGPLIAKEGDFWKSIYGDGALYTSGSEKDISEKMMTLYKDENVRNDVISKGRLIVAEYDWNIAADLLWHRIQNTATN